ncbi:hypothetical protein LCGC14_1136860 [marine sediment metagenome]|uniref:Uncharacterized protein n=1 Tax=marine sediment metagenome TaxID=412755 RepID=A0A0F9Q554_9ZZZZ
MGNKTKVTLNKGGSKEKSMPISKVGIPDLWHITEALRTNGKVADGPGCADLILECWHRTHDFKRHIQES